MTGGMVVLVAPGIGIALLFLSGRPIPRHVFIFEMLVKLSERLAMPESQGEFRMRKAA